MMTGIYMVLQTDIETHIVHTHTHTHIYQLKASLGKGVIRLEDLQEGSVDPDI